MKKSTIWIILAVVLVIIGVVFFMNSRNKDDESPAPEESASSSEEAKPSEETKPSEEAKPSEEVKPSEEAKEEIKIDYNNTDITDWMKSEGDTDGATTKLISIDMVPYGTAGSSLQLAAAGVNMLDLSNEESTMDSLKTYLESMTDIQKDYFSFQWESVYKSASSSLSNPEDAKALLADAGIEDFDPSLYTKEKLDSLYNEGVKLLTEMGVTNEWKNFTDIEPFFTVK